MEIVLFLQCLFIGFAISAPVGAAGALVIRRTLEKSSWLGFFVGLGAAASDLVFALLGLMGSLGVQEFLRRYETPILLAGGCVLLAMATQSEVNRRVNKGSGSREKISLNASLESLDSVQVLVHEIPVERLRKRQLFECFVQGFVLTIINPLALFGFLGLFLVFSVSDKMPPGPWGVFVVLWGVFSGALFWWISLARLSRWMRIRLADTWTDRLIVATNLLIFLSSALFFGRVLFF